MGCALRSVSSTSSTMTNEDVRSLVPPGNAVLDPFEFFESMPKIAFSTSVAEAFRVIGENVDDIRRETRWACLL